MGTTTSSTTTTLTSTPISRTRSSSRTEGRYSSSQLSEKGQSSGSHTGELLAILVPASAILLLLLLVAVALTVVICRRRIEKLRKRHSEVRQGVVRLGLPVGNIYQEVDDVYLVPRPIMPPPSQG